MIRVGVLIIVLILSGCMAATKGTKLDRIPLIPTSVFNPLGATVYSPNEKGWFLIKSNAVSTIFSRKYGSPLNTAVAATILYKVDGNLNDNEFITYSKKKLNELGDENNIKIINTNSDVVTHKGTTCLRYNSLSEDHRVIDVLPDKFLYLKVVGYVCRHPFSRNLALRMELSNRSIKTSFEKGLMEIAESFNKNIDFRPNALKRGRGIFASLIPKKVADKDKSGKVHYGYKVASSEYLKISSGNTTFRDPEDLITYLSRQSSEVQDNGIWIMTNHPDAYYIREKESIEKLKKLAQEKYYPIFFVRGADMPYGWQGPSTFSLLSDNDIKYQRVYEEAKKILSGKQALEKFEDYYKKRKHKAFVESEDGPWRYVSGKASRKLAIENALKGCNARNINAGNEHPCKIINVNNEWFSK